jgi:hypothetical protein
MNVIYEGLPREYLQYERRKEQLRVMKMIYIGFLAIGKPGNPGYDSDSVPCAVPVPHTYDIDAVIIIRTFYRTGVQFGI